MCTRNINKEAVPAKVNKILATQTRNLLKFYLITAYELPQCQWNLSNYGNQTEAHEAMQNRLISLPDIFQK